MIWYIRAPQKKVASLVFHNLVNISFKEKHPGTVAIFLKSTTNDEYIETYLPLSEQKASITPLAAISCYVDIPYF